MVEKLAPFGPKLKKILDYLKIYSGKNKAIISILNFKEIPT